MAGHTSHIKISCDCEDLLALIAGLPATKAALAKMPPEVRNELVRFAELPKDFITINSDVPCAASTGELIVRLEPNDRLLGLVTALGARDVD